MMPYTPPFIGGTALLYTHLTARIKARGFTTIEMTRIGGTVYKRHRIYRLRPE